METQMNDLEKFYADSFKGLKVGAITKGKILQIKSDGMIVDVGLKSEGFIPTRELVNNELQDMHPGDEIEVFIERMSNSDGFVKLSRQKAEGARMWDMIENAFNNSQPVDGKITGKVKGGMTVSIGGVVAFLPGSQIDLKAPKNTDALIGHTFAFKVLNFNNKGSNVIISRRALLEEERKELREKTIATFKDGLILEGTVKNLTDYGAFIDLGGIDGLLHISDMSWGRISHPGELFSIGDKVEVIILSFDPGNNKVTLGYKQKSPDPWEAVEEKYPADHIVIGKIITITDYGIFIELEEGVEGLIHVSEIDWLEKNIKPSKYFSVGESVEAVILKVSKSDKKISLSIRKLKPNPWEVIKDKYTIGQKIQGTVKSFAEFGAFVSLDEGVDALLHISDMSWIKRIRHPSDVLKKGQQIEVVVLNIEPEKERISVGIKELTDDPWIEEIPNKYSLGDTVNCTVVNLTDFGLFVEFDDGIEGLIHRSEVDKKPDEKVEEIFKIGAELSARIINIIPDERKIDLSMKTMVG
jgi:small subunit ribosomal protein S1